MDILYTDGRRESNDDYECGELRLIRACYSDNADEVRFVLDKFPNIDVNAIVLHSPTRGNGSALILTGSKEIAQLLLDRGAHINLIYDTGSAKITALDSAKKELTKSVTSADTNLPENIKELISFLESKGAKTYENLIQSGLI